MKEVGHIQKKFTSSKKPRRTEDVSRISAKLIMEGKISAALKFLETETSKGILSLTDDILEELKGKHLHAATIQEDSLLYGPINYIPPNIFGSIDEDSVQSSFKIQRSCRPIGYGCGIVSQNTLLKKFRETIKKTQRRDCFNDKKLIDLTLSPFHFGSICHMPSNPS